MLIGILLIIAIVYFLFFRPKPYRRVYDNDPYYSSGTGMGSFVGGMATGALLTYLLEQGRIGMDEYHYYNSIGEQQMMNELMDQNLIQQEEIDDLRFRLDQQGYDQNNYNQTEYDQNNYDDTSFNDYSDDDYI